MADSIKIEITGLGQVTAALDGLRSRMEEATRQATVTAGSKLQNLAVTSFNNPPAPYTRTGNLQRSIKQNAVAATGLGAYSITVAPSAIYARIQEYGGTIHPKQAKMLSWIGPDGKRVFARKVTIHPHPYMHPAFEKMRGDMSPTYLSAWRKAFSG